MVGNVPIGGDSPISVQTMTKTKTSDITATVAQIQRCNNSGADIVRLTVNDKEAADASGQGSGPFPCDSACLRGAGHFHPAVVPLPADKAPQVSG